MIPGFVDSHTHLVFAGDRRDEFAARMAGAPYAASGFRETDSATRAASTEQLHALADARRREALRAGVTDVEIKSGYGLDVEHEQRSCAIAGQFTADVTFLGAHIVPEAYEDRADDYVDLVCGEMLAACSRTPAGSTCSASGAPSTPTSRARCWRPAEPRAWGCASTPASSAPGRGSSLGSSWALAAATPGGARALRRSDIGHLGVGARADAVLLDRRCEQQQGKKSRPGRSSRTHERIDVRYESGRVIK